MSGTGRFRLADAALGGAALLAVAAALWHLLAASAGLDIRTALVGQTPVTIFAPQAKVARGPAVVIAHGFAGSQQLMQSFALALARNGYVAVTFDFLGHGRNPRPLTGSITEESGATAALVTETAEVADFARTLGDGRLAALGHSMASDIVVRFAETDPDVGATIAVSMFSPAVTRNAPRNLLVVVGAWEGPLRAEALRVVGQVSAPAPPAEAVTYGSFVDGTARRAAVSDHVEHIGVLFSMDTMREMLDWLDRSFGRPRPHEDDPGGRGAWLAVLFVGLIGLGRPLTSALPTVSQRPQGAGLAWRRLWPAILVPMVATPLILRFVPTDGLSVPVGGYLAAHFALYGILTALCIGWLKRRSPAAPRAATSWPAALFGALILAVFNIVILGTAIDSFLTSFALNALRWPLFAATLVGTSAYFLAGEWLVRGVPAARGGSVCLQFAFLASLAIAVAIDLEHLFFLIIIVPAVVICLVVAGLMSRWAYRRTGHPAVGAMGNAVFLAWAIAATFPILAA